MDRNKTITGQIVLRDSSGGPLKKDDPRKIMMVVGVLAVPKELNLKGEHKYTVCSKANSSRLGSLFQMMDPDFPDMDKLHPEFEEIVLALFPETEENLSDETTGDGLGGIITSHGRWRV